ncbi:MAG: hypothetical protein CVV52_03865 [Spirochaetae bacterium HGW-Spirochaetae-8]|nr:MAG: hypothetical protein CVV52_03865 [Spirochaetae bacterium HGW-Spirochaetae-8]
MEVLIFGAGKIARGFIGHMLWKGGYGFHFVESNESLVQRLNESKSYQVRILGKEIIVDTVSGFDAFGYLDTEPILKAIAHTITTIFISVGGKNLPGVGRCIRDGLFRRMQECNQKPINIVLCENWLQPATIISNSIFTDASAEFDQYCRSHVGIAESVIMRSAIEPTTEIQKNDPLSINVQDFWHFPVDAKGLKTQLPNLPGLEYVDNFSGYLERKFYTYNAANGTVSYLGYQKGYTYMSDAAKDPEIVTILSKVYQETGFALCKKFNFDFTSHMEFTKTSLQKLQDEFLVDYIERNARDPIRKLGPNDRLVGPAKLVLEYGGVPDALSMAIAAAIYYDEPSDSSAQLLKSYRQTYGIEYILNRVCMLTPADSILKNLIMKNCEIVRASSRL